MHYRKFLFLLFFLLVFLFSSAFAETVLWEDENGTVLLGDSGEISFISADGHETGTISTQQSGQADAAAPSSLEEGYFIPAEAETADSSSAEVPTVFITPVPYDENDLPSGTPVPDAASSFVFRKTLRYGDSGEAVSRLQSRLLELGYYDARVSGGYYKITQSAVRAFQKQNGLTADGIAGRQTQEALYSASAVSVWESPLPQPTPVPTQYKLMVDVTNQIVRAYTYDENGQYSILVREMVCSTGTTKNPTPLGTTIMPKSRARWGYFPTWDSHAQYLTRIDKANAFHSVLYSAPNEKALSVSSYKALGTRQSHGCVRLVVSDAKWIYDNCQAGTIITVYESGIPDPEYTMSIKPALDENTLREIPRPAPTPLPVYSPENWPTSYRTLRRGKTGQDVFMLQMRLRELGYYQGSITGGYYEGTIEAVKAFQRDNGLSVDGLAGKNTQALLFRQTETEPQELPSETPVPDSTPVPTFTPEPIPYIPVDQIVG